MNNTINATLPDGSPLTLEIRVTSPPERLLTRKELAEKLQLTLKTIISLEKKGLPRIQLGAVNVRYSWSAVMRWASMSAQSPFIEIPKE